MSQAEVIGASVGAPERKKLSAVLPTILKSGVIASFTLLNPAMGAAAALTMFSGEFLYKLYKKSDEEGGIIEALESIRRDVEVHWNFVKSTFDSHTSTEDRIARGIGAGVGAVLGIAVVGIAQLPLNEIVGVVGGRVAATTLRTIGLSGAMQELAKLGLAQAEKRGVEDPKDWVLQAAHAAGLVTSAVALVAMSSATAEVAASFADIGFDFVNQLVTSNPEQLAADPSTVTPQLEATPTLPLDSTVVSPTVTPTFELEPPLEASEWTVPRIIEVDFLAGRPLLTVDDGLGGVDSDGDNKIDTYYDLAEVDMYREHGETPLPVAFDMHEYGEQNAYRAATVSPSEIDSYHIWTLASTNGELKAAHIEGLDFDTATNSWGWDQIVSSGQTETYQYNSSGVWVEGDQLSIANTSEETGDISFPDEATSITEAGEVEIIRDVHGRPVYYISEQSSTTLVYGPDGGTVGIVQDVLARTHTDWSGNDIGLSGYKLGSELNLLLSHHADPGASISVHPGDTLDSIMDRYKVPPDEAAGFVSKIQSAIKP